MSFVLKNVGFSYFVKYSDPQPRPQTEVVVLKDLNLTFPSGSRIALLGASGAGKSTLICILGLLTGTQRIQGEIEYTNSKGQKFPYRGMSAANAEFLRRTEFGFALQSSYLLPHLTVVENLELPLGLNGISTMDRRKRALQLLEQAEGKMLDLAESLPSELSGGEQQRVAVLRALIHNPVVVFADEPFSALDEGNKALILQMLVNWHRNGLNGVAPSAAKRTLFMVCHDPDVPAKYDATPIRIGSQNIEQDPRGFSNREPRL